MMLLPMVYKIIPAKQGEFQIVPAMQRFEVPKRVYGPIEKKAKYFWNVYRRGDKSLGVLLTGYAGTGKTELAKMLSNLAITGGMPVIMISEVQVTLKLIQMLNTLDRVALFFDEYAKVIPHHMQEKMLTMLSTTFGGKKLFILTENHSNMISEFIRNRPGRIRYHLEFGRIDEETYKDYMADHEVTDIFRKELDLLFKTNTKFTFDHLMALVEEHAITPNSTLKQLLEIMNLKVLSKKLYFNVVACNNIETGEPVLFKQSSVVDHMRFVEYGSVLTVMLIEVTDDKENVFKTLSLTNEDIAEITDDEVTVTKDGFKFTLTDTEDKPVTDNNPGMPFNRNNFLR